MHPRSHRAVLRYFAPADAFVRIGILAGPAASLPAKAGISRRDYQNLVIRACCPELSASALAELREHEDPLAADELLYQLCVSENPHLDLHSARLTEAGVTPAPATAPARSGAQRSLRERVGKLRQRLEREVVGQADALNSVCACLRRSAAGLKSEHRPLASFLFAGRTGVGKTELARALARELFGASGESGLVRIDCSEFAAAHEYAKLIGAPPGYVGHEHGGVLTEALRRRPECVVLFDEIEKAHPRMSHLLLQVLDEGRLTDGRGRGIDFTRAVVCLTSNLGAQELRRAQQRVGFDSGAQLGAAVGRELTHHAIEEYFAPELLARLDERIVFHDLRADDAREIARRRLAELARRVRAQGVVLEWSRPVAEWVARYGFDGERGARELGHVVRRAIEAPLAELLLARRPRADARVLVGIVRGEPRVSWAPTRRRAA